jgi:hypothetical protein
MTSFIVFYVKLIFSFIYIYFNPILLTGLLDSLETLQFLYWYLRIHQINET